MRQQLFQIAVEMLKQSARMAGFAAAAAGKAVQLHSEE